MSLVLCSVLRKIVDFVSETCSISCLVLTRCCQLPTYTETLSSLIYNFIWTLSFYQCQDVLKSTTTRSLHVVMRIIIFLIIYTGEDLVNQTDSQYLSLSYKLTDNNGRNSGGKKKSKILFVLGNGGSVAAIRKCCSLRRAF